MTRLWGWPDGGHASREPAAGDPAQAVRDALLAIRTDMTDCPLDEVLDRIEADLPAAVAARLNQPAGGTE